MAVPDSARPDTAVRVEKGDTLSAIAKEAGISLATLYDLNPKFKTDPKYQGGNMIFSNTLVNLAPATKAATSTPTPTPTPGGTVTPDVPVVPVVPVVPTPGSGDTYKSGAGTPPGQVDGGGATGAMPGGATAFSGGFTQADIDKAFKAGEATAAKVAADNIYANKVKASDKLITLFKAQGIDDPGFAKFISDNIMNDVSEAQTLIDIYDQPVYKLRFPGMEALRKKNRAITEDTYIKLENQIVQTLKFFDLPVGFYDNRTMLGSIIGNEVSPKEVQDRAQAAQDLVKSTNPEIRKALKEFYNIGEGDITANFLNGDLAGPLLLKQARAAEIAGIAKTTGFDTFTNTEAQGLAEKDVYKSMNLTDLTTAIGKAGTLADTQKRLAYIEQGTYSDREALQATIEADQQAILASQRRAARETARFSGSSGLSSGSLRQSSGI